MIFKTQRAQPQSAVGQQHGAADSKQLSSVSVTLRPLTFDLSAENCVCHLTTHVASNSRAKCEISSSFPRAAARQRDRAARQGPYVWTV